MKNIIGSTSRTSETTSVSLLLFLLLTLSLHAQEPLRPRFGLIGHVGFNTHVADFPRIPGTASCCLGFEGGSGIGFDAGGLFEVPLSDRILLGGRITFMNQPFSMVRAEETYVIADGVGGEGMFEHRLEGSVSTIGIEPTLSVRLFGSLFLQGGIWAGYPISGSYEQKEQLTQPTGSGTFLNADGSDSQKRTRNEFSGELPSPSFAIAPVAGLAYELPMNREGTLRLVPGISWQPGLTDVIADVSWKINTLRTGVAVKFSPKGGKEHRYLREVVTDTVLLEVPQVVQAYTRGTELRLETTGEREGMIVTTETIRRTDTLFRAKPAASPEPALTAAVRVAGVRADGSEEPISHLKIEEFSSTLMTPLLNYIFFDENSGTIPDRYRKLSEAGVEAFSIDRINSPDRLPTYHHLLNIVGRRLRDYPEATLTLTGCNQDIRDEKGDLELSGRRAEGVKEYLTSLWKIDGGRIRVERRGLPEKGANTTTADGSQENRRVELLSDDPRILAPIITGDTLRRVDPPVLRFHTSAAADAGVTSWTLQAEGSGTVLKSFSGGEQIPASVDWNIGREPGTSPQFEGTMACILQVTDGKGGTAEARSAIPVEQVTIGKKRMERRGDTEIDRFSLILFDVRSAELLPVHGAVIDLIRREIGPNSTVRVTGFTDRLGDETYNQQLAERRAKSVTALLGGNVNSSTGIGEADLFDSELPEGRLYSRTVEVIIETPVKE